jgi:predicted 3-demethylubiquinone-9 3-methyltransferase (glyoxalase superfamily)
MQKIAPCLWFDEKAEEAAAFYVSVFPGSEIVSVTRYGSAGPGPEGTAMTVSFTVEGREFAALNGGPQFTFSPAISFVINCETQEEVDTYWEKLGDGGEEGQCGWLTDRYGVSWQVVPTVLEEMLGDTDGARSQRVMQAMLQMVKLDIEGLKRAYED